MSEELEMQGKKIAYEKTEYVGRMCLKISNFIKLYDEKHKLIDFCFFFSDKSVSLCAFNGFKINN